MLTLNEIETAIKQLPKEELQQLAVWFDNYLDDEWDQQMETDLQAGKLDQLIAKAEKDIATSKIRNLDGIFHH